jgi:hypothetical protein
VCRWWATHRVVQTGGNNASRPLSPHSKHPTYVFKSNTVATIPRLRHDLNGSSHRHLPSAFPSRRESRCLARGHPLSTANCLLTTFPLLLSHPLPKTDLPPGIPPPTFQLWMGTAIAPIRRLLSNTCCPRVCPVSSWQLRRLSSRDVPPSVICPITRHSADTLAAPSRSTRPCPSPGLTIASLLHPQVHA